MIANVDDVIEQVSGVIQNKIPNKIYEPIFKGMRLAKRRILK